MNIHALRRETPGCHDKIFLNSAGSSLMPDVVAKKMIDYLQDEQMIGGYGLAEKYDIEQCDFYNQVAKLIHAKPNEICFAASATDAYSKALSCIPFAKGDIILTSETDYVSNQLAFLSLQKRMGIDVIRCRHLPNDDIDLADIESKIEEYKPKLVAITHVPTNSGIVQDVVRIGKMCANRDILYLVDGCQSIGQFEVDVNEIQCDFLTATGRKFLRGPRGTGFLFVSEKVLNAGLYPLFFDQNGATWTGENTFELNPAAVRFENWEKNYAGLLGLKEAVCYLNEVGIKNVAERNDHLQKYFRELLAQVKNIKVQDEGSKLCSLITVTKEDGSIKELKSVLDYHSVSYSISGVDGAVIDFGKKGIQEVVRFSPHYFNTEEELHQVAGILASI